MQKNKANECISFSGRFLCLAHLIVGVYFSPLPETLLCTYDSLLGFRRMAPRPDVLEKPDFSDYLAKSSKSAKNVFSRLSPQYLIDRVAKGAFREHFDYMMSETHFTTESLTIMHGNQSESLVPALLV